MSYNREVTRFVGTIIGIVLILAVAVLFMLGFISITFNTSGVFTKADPITVPTSTQTVDNTVGQTIPAPRNPLVSTNTFSPTNFRGPTSPPHIIGPTSNPPNY